MHLLTVCCLCLRYMRSPHSLDFGLLMLMIAVSNYILGLGLDTWGFTARQLAAGLGFAMMIPGILWLPAVRRWTRNAA